MTAPHIVGVHVFAACSLKNSKAFPIAAFSLICFQSFAYCKSLIYWGVIRKPTRKVASQKPKICTKSAFIKEKKHRIIMKESVSSLAKK